MFTYHKSHDFPEARYRKPVLLLVQLQFFDSDNIARRLFSSPEDDSIGTLFNVIQAFIAVDRSA